MVRVSVVVRVRFKFMVRVADGKQQFGSLMHICISSYLR